MQSNIAATDPIVRYADGVPDYLRRMHRRAFESQPAWGWKSDAMLEAIDEIEHFGRLHRHKPQPRPDTLVHLKGVRGLLVEALHSLCTPYHELEIKRLQSLIRRLGLLEDEVRYGKEAVDQVRSRQEVPA